MRPGARLFEPGGRGGAVVADGRAALLPVRGEPAARRFLRAARKYWNILRASLVERMAYRADFFISTLLRFLPMVTTILVWEAIYAGAGGEDVSLGGYSRDEMIAYLLLVHISRMFSSMPGLANGIARDVRDGSLKKYLLQPIEMIPYLLSYRAAHKAAYIVMTSVPYALLFFLCRDFFPGWPEPLTLAAYAASLLLAFLIGFFFECCMGTIAFWFLEVSSFLYVINTINFFISGQMLPLDFLSPFWAGLLKSLPFQYLAYFPATIFLGKVEGEELAYGLLGELAWALAFIVLAHTLYRLGLRRYSAYGG
jgi:ABC-2 type transport system permease protein